MRRCRRDWNASSIPPTFTQGVLYENEGVLAVAHRPDRGGNHADGASRHPGRTARSGQQPGQSELGRGCAACGGTGYAGRTGVFEVMPVSRAVRDLISDGAPTRDIRNAVHGLEVWPFS